MPGESIWNLWREIKDFARISNISKFDADEYVKSLDSYALLIIDDLGAEQDSEFALQNIGNVINRRWTSGKPLIVTTNLDLACQNGIWLPTEYSFTNSL